MIFEKNSLHFMSLGFHAGKANLSVLVEMAPGTDVEG